MNPGIIAQKGYSWLVQPRPDILPLSLLEQEGSVLRRIWHNITGTPSTGQPINSDIFDLFPRPDRGAAPEVSQAQPIPGFKGKDVLDIEGHIALKGLKSLDVVGSADAEARINRARKLIYAFTSLHLLKTNQVLLEEHLNIQRPSGHAAGYLEKLRQGRIYVVTEVMQSADFSVQDATSFEAEGAITVEAIEGYLAKLNASASINSGHQEKMEYKGPQTVSIALKAYKIQVNDKGQYSLKSVKLEVVRGDDDQPDTGLDTPWITIE